MTETSTIPGKGSEPTKPRTGTETDNDNGIVKPGTLTTVAETGDPGTGTVKKPGITIPGEKGGNTSK